MSRERRVWRRANVAWVLYFVLVFTVGRRPEYQAIVIWQGGAAISLLTGFLMLRSRVGPPRSSVLIWLFAAWCLLGYTVATEMESFRRYMVLVLELATVITFVSTSIKRSGDIRLWYLAFLGVGVTNVLFGEVMDVLPLALEGVAVERQRGMSGGPNALGLVSFLGVLGSGLLAGMERRRWLIVAFVAGAMACALGVLLSGSRAAFLATVMFGLGWPILCGRRRLRHPIFSAVVLGLVLFGVGPVVKRIFGSSTLARRMERLERGQDRSAKIRAALALAGLDLVAENPILGVGLGQFAEASGTGLYAHGDWAEVLATTGVPGFLLYIGAMTGVGRRLWRATRAYRGTTQEEEMRAALLALAVVLGTGAVTWPHFITIHSMFLLGVIFGVAELDGRGRGRIKEAPERRRFSPANLTRSARAPG